MREIDELSSKQTNQPRHTEELAIQTSQTLSGENELKQRIVQLERCKKTGLSYIFSFDMVYCI